MSLARGHGAATPQHGQHISADRNHRPAPQEVHHAARCHGQDHYRRHERKRRRKNHVAEEACDHGENKCQEEQNRDRIGQRTRRHTKHRQVAGALSHLNLAACRLVKPVKCVVVAHRAQEERFNPGFDGQVAWLFRRRQGTALRQVGGEAAQQLARIADGEPE